MGGYPPVLVVAAEPSGDQAAARVAAHLRDRARLFGVGGDALAAEGVRLLAHIRDLSAIGVRAGLERLGGFARAWTAIRKSIAAEPPVVALLVDAPEMNLPLARVLKAAGVQVVYYIGPQVWAWRRRRLGLLKARVDITALVLPFEKPLYDAEGVPAVFVGHPILDRPPSLLPDAVSARLDIDRRRKVLSMLPGSRPGEVNRHLPVMIDAGARLAARGVQVVVALPPALQSEARVRAVSDAGLRLMPAGVAVPDLFQLTDAAIVASGTATLEAAVAGVPMTAVYRVDALSYTAGRYLFKIPWVALPNWIAGRAVVPELLQDAVSPERLLHQGLRLLTLEERHRQRPLLEEVADGLGTPGAAARVARLLAERLR